MIHMTEEQKKLYEEQAEKYADDNEGGEYIREAVVWAYQAGFTAGIESERARWQSYLEEYGELCAKLDKQEECIEKLIYAVGVAIGALETVKLCPYDFNQDGVAAIAAKLNAILAQVIDVKDSLKPL